MLTDAIYRFLEKKPFTPFTLSLTDRSTVRIVNPATATVSFGGDVLRLKHENGCESLISIRHVVSLTPDPPPDVPIVVK